MDSMEILGILSALMALVAFVGLEFGRLRARNFWYDGLNLLSSIGLVAYAIQIGGVPFIITNSVWAVVSATDIVRNILRRTQRS